MNMKKFLISLAVIGSIFSFSVSYANDDVGVISNLNKTTDWNSYLTMYNYKTWLSDHRYSKNDIYASADNLVLISFFDDKMDRIFIRGQGYATNRGIEVGMTLQDVVSAYGNPYAERTGLGNYSGYLVLEYVSKANEGLSFVFNIYTEQLLLIRYQADRHGSSNVMADVEELNLLPYLL